VIAGYTFKIIRESVALTQYELAGRFDIDPTTVQAWESARRPLTGVSIGTLCRLRARLTGSGANPAMVDLLGSAVEADLIISDAVRVGAQLDRTGQQLLASRVHRRALTRMITWPLTGSPPPILAEVQGQPVRRGPVSDRPVLTAEERTRFFDHLLAAADAHQDDERSLLRRQAIYLLGFDDRVSSVDWLAAEQRRALRKVGRADDVPSWVSVRSSAVALAQKGNRDPLRAFVDGGLRTEEHDVANLNYWAYWVGEYADSHTDDEFMVNTRPTDWNGAKLLEHLADNLTPGSAQLELYIHTLWFLLTARPGLLERRSPKVQTGIELADSDPDLTSRARRELASVAYAIRLARR
jgi:transcriptional regulator with XRE-family HTH domain